MGRIWVGFTWFYIGVVYACNELYLNYAGVGYGLADDFTNVLHSLADAKDDPMGFGCGTP